MTCDLSEVMFEGIPIKCATCGGCFHELTRKFEPVPPVRGSYLRMLPRYRGNGWYAFPEYDWVVGDNVQCPRCGMPYRMASIIRQVKRYLERLNTRPPAQKVKPVEPETHDDTDDVGIYDSGAESGDLRSVVMKMTFDGETQARIAETCQISVYMVRQIQNGKKV